MNEEDLIKGIDKLNETFKMCNSLLLSNLFKVKKG